MGEPIILWDSNGVMWIMHSPAAAQSLVDKGVLSWEAPPNAPPLIVVPEPTPDDTQEVATVKPPKRKREKGDGGVL
jgi:hypothetical protein